MGTPLFDGALKIVKKWGDVDRDALLDAVTGLAALLVGAGGVTSNEPTEQLRGRGDFITGAALLQSAGCNFTSRYLASAAVVAVAAAIQSHFDPGNYDEEA